EITYLILGVDAKIEVSMLALNTSTDLATLESWRKKTA
ncbi:MAG: hypothetical protein ACI814_000750, partial [Mariniblastus sp.]